MGIDTQAEMAMKIGGSGNIFLLILLAPFLPEKQAIYFCSQAPKSPGGFQVAIFLIITRKDEAGEGARSKAEGLSLS
jgi:hypothetical protein